MSRRKHKTNFAELRAKAKARTDIAPSDRHFDGRRGETKTCSNCEGVGWGPEDLCNDCAGWGVVLIGREIEENARARRWREEMNEEIKRLGITENEFYSAENAWFGIGFDDGKRVSERALEAEWARESEEPLDPESEELRFGTNGERISPDSRRRRRRPA